jgi:hypothetical protein
MLATRQLEETNNYWSYLKFKNDNYLIMIYLILSYWWQKNYINCLFKFFLKQKVDLKDYYNID